MAEMDLSSLSPSPHFQTSNTENLQQNLPQVPCCQHSLDWLIHSNRPHSFFQFSSSPIMELSNVHIELQRGHTEVRNTTLSYGLLWMYDLVHMLLLSYVVVWQPKGSALTPCICMTDAWWGREGLWRAAAGCVQAGGPAGWAGPLEHRGHGLLPAPKGEQAPRTLCIGICSQGQQTKTLCTFISYIQVVYIANHGTCFDLWNWL